MSLTTERFFTFVQDAMFLLGTLLLLVLVALLLWIAVAYLLDVTQTAQAPAATWLMERRDSRQ